MIELKKLQRLQDALSISRDPFQPHADADKHLLRFHIRVSLSQKKLDQLYRPLLTFKLLACAALIAWHRRCIAVCTASHPSGQAEPRPQLLQRLQHAACRSDVVSLAVRVLVMPAKNLLMSAVAHVLCAKLRVRSC